MLRTLPVELLLYISRILRKRKLFKIREKLDSDGVFNRHVIIANYISNGEFYRRMRYPPDWNIQNFPMISGTVLSFEVELQHSFIQVTSTEIDLKNIRETVEWMRGKKMVV